eukprot:81985-Prymnesium_polylepis.1
MSPPCRHRPLVRQHRWRPAARLSCCRRAHGEFVRPPPCLPRLDDIHGPAVSAAYRGPPL